MKKPVLNYNCLSINSNQYAIEVDKLYRIPLTYFLLLTGNIKDILLIQNNIRYHLSDNNKEIYYIYRVQFFVFWLALLILALLKRFRRFSNLKLNSDTNSPLLKIDQIMTINCGLWWQKSERILIKIYLMNYQIVSQNGLKQLLQIITVILNGSLPGLK